MLYALSHCEVSDARHPLLSRPVGSEVECP
jgi:hypothetical protein